MNQILNNDDPNFYLIPDKQSTIAEILLLASMESNSGQTFNQRYSGDYKKIRFTIFWNLDDSKINMEWYERIDKKTKELGLNSIITGKNSLGNRMNNYIVSTFITSMGIAIVLIFIVLSILFNSIKLGLFSLIPNVFPVFIGTGLMSFNSHSIEAGAVLVCAVCLGISVDDTIHLMLNYLRNLREGLNKKEALKEVVAHTGVALIVTTVILAVGFGVFIFADFIPNIRFGAYSATVLVMALTIDLIFLPALLLLRSKSS